MKKLNGTEGPKPGYKHTELGWIPEDWEIVRLGEICATFQSGYGITSQDIFSEGEFSVYGGNGLRGYTNKFTHDGEYLLIGRQGALCGNISFVDGKNYISEHAIAVSSNEKSDVKWLRYHLDFLDLNKLSESSAQPGLAVNKLVKIKISKPTLHEQKVIAQILSTWDSAITKTTQLIQLHQQRKKALMQQLLTGKKRLPGFGGAWKKTGAGELFKSVSVKGFKNEELLSATQDKGMIPRSMLEARVTMPAGDTDSFKLVEVGDFVISLRSFQGGLEYSNYRGIVSPAYTVLKPKKAINDAFYKQYFKSYEFIGRLAVAVIGIRDGKQISYEDFCIIKIPDLSIEEQTAIASILQTADNEIALLQKKRDALKEQKKGLMQQLLTGKKRVKV